ncbi:MAG: DsrE family protein [Rhodoferax sp.]|uniref:DsrE family protein n=1 Tax=Rhodoferax sp. TaxID=50421 RepID=UPI0027212A17|nr:DsrE family protein [Rhodoferax sp.]MDO8449738.1 DsrE family protein [Rhodoferax sp.]
MTTFKHAALNSTGRRTLLSLGAIVLAATLMSSEAQAQATTAKNKIVFQVSDSDPAKWGLALNNVQNVQTDLGAENVEQEIVVYGPGIGMLKTDSPVAQRIAGALKSGVKVVACETTLRAQKLTHADMLPTIGYVPAGVVELMQKQQQGYAYIRP